MAIRTTQFALRSLGATGGQVLFTCPAGQRALVKYVSLISFAAAPGAVLVGLITPTFSLGALLYKAVGVQNQLEVASGLYGVLNAGEQLFAQVGSVTGGGYWVTAGGVLFDL